jgi:FMN phosphatase YigB (HAD superfamily)
MRDSLRHIEAPTDDVVTAEDVGSYKPGPAVPAGTR